MNKTSIILIVAIVLLVILGIFLGKDDAQTANEKNTGETSGESLDRKFDVQHSYEDGEHAFAGIINAPTPCHTVEVESKESKEGVQLIVSVDSEEETCAQVVTQKSFLYTVESDMEEVAPQAMINGESVDLNIFPRETIDAIDLDDFSVKG